VERSAWFVAVLLLRHGGTVANEFSKNRDRLFADSSLPASLMHINKNFEGTRLHGVQF
jgi:hypothetical protein